MLKKEIKVSKETATVMVDLGRWKPGVQKLRFYEQDARNLLAESHPNLVLGAVLKPAVARNQAEDTTGTWVFEIVQTAPEKEVLKEKKEKKENPSKEKTKEVPDVAEHSTGSAGDEKGQGNKGKVSVVDGD